MDNTTDPLVLALDLTRALGVRLPDLRLLVRELALDPELAAQARRVVTHARRRPRARIVRRGRR